MSRLMVDTSAYSALTRNHPDIKRAVESAREIRVSPVVLGELHFGFRGGGRQSSNHDKLRRFLDTPGVAVVEIGEATALCYAEIRRYLQQKGTPIPANDVWIAAGAMEHGLRVITTDAHFRRIPQVLVDYYAPKGELQNEANSG